MLFERKKNVKENCRATQEVYKGQNKKKQKTKKENVVLRKIILE